MEHPAKRRRLNLPAAFVKIATPEESNRVIELLHALLSVGGMDLKQIIGMPRRVLNAATVQQLPQYSWWVSEKSAHPWFWWILTPGSEGAGPKSYFVDHHMNIFAIERSEDFCYLFSQQSATLTEGNLIPKNNNADKFGYEFLLNDVLVFKNTSLLNLPYEKRLPLIFKELVLPYRNHAKKLKFPFAIRGKFIVDLARVGKIISGQRFSQTAGLRMFRDEKNRENRTDGLLFRRADHDWTVSDSDQRLLVWRYPPSFVGALYSPFVDPKKEKLQISLLCDVDGVPKEVLCLESGVSSESQKLLNRSQEHSLRAQFFYDSDHSRFEILRILPAASQTDTLEHVMKVLQSQMGTIPIGKVKKFCLEAMKAQKVKREGFR